MLKAIKFIFLYILASCLLTMSMYYAPNWLISLYFFSFFIIIIVSVWAILSIDTGEKK